MLTFSMLTSRAQDICGITASQDITNIQMDLNQALRIFKNASRRYWTRKEIVANVVAGQQYYTLPEDVVRITEVRANTGAGSYNWPMVQIDSEDLWNRYNIIQSMTVIVPQFYFVRGRNEIGMYPIPSTNVTNGLIVSYESRMTDMSLADTVGLTVGVTQGSQTVTSSSGFNQNMVGMWFGVTDGSDGNWYPIISYTNSSSITLENYYQGYTSNSATATIGSAPDIPEDYHLALVYFACYMFFLKRKDNETASMYKALFEDMLTQYREVYAAKTTGLIQKPQTDSIFNIFHLPPSGLTG